MKYPFVLLLCAIWLAGPFTAHSQNTQTRNSGKTVVVFYGDDIINGTGLRKPERDSLFAKVKAQYSDKQYAFYDLSVAKQTTATGVFHSNNLLALRPQIVIIGLGLNDAIEQKPVESVKNNLRILVEQSRRVGAYPLLLGFRAPKGSSVKYALQFNTIFSAIAEEFNIPYIGDFLSPIAEKEKYLQINSTTNPNYVGTGVLAGKLNEMLKEMVKYVRR